ncbi:MAG: hypothetical protein LBU47_02880 [Christensenellaceae bacterium]|jgi:aminoglycoside 6'-N-acetyltransferase I|nr:hypothetical protein [Christensenellaceae bacterium]
MACRIGASSSPPFFEQLGRRPVEFYQKQGYQIVGVIPDANGPGKPDLYMAKGLRR